MDSNGREQRTPIRVLIAGAGLALIIALGAIAIVTENAGADQSSVLDDGERYLEDAVVSPEEAVAIARSDTSGRVEAVDLKQNGGELIYTIEIDDQIVTVDATTGVVLIVEHDNDDDFTSRHKLPGDDLE